MQKEDIRCPNCGYSIEISQALSNEIEIEYREKYEKEFELLKQSNNKLIEEKEEEFEKKLKEEKKLMESKLKKKAMESISVEMSDLKEELDEKEKKLQDSQKQELELRKKTRELQDKERELELETSRKIDQETEKIKEKVINEYDEKHRLKDAEKDKQLQDMKKQIDELKRKSEQGSQQIQGEVLELQLEEQLRKEFPFDEIIPVPKGVKGGDIIHNVMSRDGQIVGKIIWEAKRTKTWNDTWISKLKVDQSEAKADLAVLVSETLPDGLDNFKQINNIWVSDLKSAISLAFVLRELLVQANRSKNFQAGKEEKMELIYNYLTGAEFRNRVEAIVDSFSNMKQDLESEKRSIQKIWAKREKQIERVVMNTVGLHGDLQGIAGSSLPRIKQLELDTEDQGD